jgi:hypothetical protein
MCDEKFGFLSSEGRESRWLSGFRLVSQSIRIQGSSQAALQPTAEASSEIAPQDRGDCCICGGCFLDRDRFVEQVHGALGFRSMVA